MSERSAQQGGILGAFRAHPILVIACGVLAGAVVLSALVLRTPEYRARAEVLFRATNVDATVLNGQTFFQQQPDAARVAATNLELVQNPAVATRVSEALEGRLSPEAVLAMMSFGQLGSSDIVGVSATDPSAATAAEVANAWAREFVALRRDADRDQVQEAISLARKELAAVRAAGGDAAREEVLAQNLEKLRVVQALQTGGAEFLEEARVPGSPTGVSTPVAVAGAVIVGLLIGLLGAYVWTRSDRRITGPNEARDALGIPLLAVVPRAPAPRRPTGVADSPHLREAFRTLAVRLRFFNLDTQRRTLVVVGGNPADGKTLVATNMARTAAQGGRRTLLIDCDLRLGDAARRFGVGAEPGLTDVLSGQCDLDRALVPLSAGTEGDVEWPSGAPGGDDTLWLLPRGAIPPNPVEMLSSRQMSDLLADCGARFDQIVIDTAPLLVVSDAEPLLTRSDGFVVVTRLGRATQDDLAELAEIIDRHRDRVLGVVVNDVPVRSRGYGGYHATPRPAADARRTEHEHVQ